eukprot:45292_1
MNARILMLGAPKCGKTELLNRFINDSFNLFDCEEPNYSSTRASTKNYVTKHTIFEREQQLYIIDFTGAITPQSQYFDHKHAVIFCYDITKQNSYKFIKQLISHVSVNLRGGYRNILKILVGTKLDLNEKRKVSRNEAITFAETQQMSYWETSANHNININEMFIDIGQIIMLATYYHINNINHIFRGFGALVNEMTFDLSDNYHIELMNVLITTLKTNQFDNYNISTTFRSKLCAKLKQELEQTQISLMLNIGIDTINTETKVNNICEMIEFLSPYTVEWDIYNCGTKKIINKLIKCNRNLNRCWIESTSMTFKPSDRDYEIYIAAMEKAAGFEFLIGTILLDAFIKNNNNIYERFILSLQNANQLEYLGLRIDSKCLKTKTYMEKLCEIFDYIQTSDIPLKCLKLEFNQFTVDNEENIEYDGLNDLYLSMVKCYKSKSNVIDDISISSNLKLIGSDGFCRELLQSKPSYYNLSEMNLELKQTKWDYNNLLLLSETIQKNQLQTLIINGKLFCDAFDINNDKKAFK